MNERPANASQAELDKFNALASRWWDPQGPQKALHALNPARNWLTDYSFVAPGLTRNWPNAAAFGLREDCP